MKDKAEKILPGEIERRSFEIISEEIGPRNWRPYEEAVVKRVIHTTADFDYLENLCFSVNAVKKGIEALKNGACIVTDTQMVKSGINKRRLAQFGGQVFCFMSDESVAREAKERHITRAAVSVERASLLSGPLIFAVGNAPTALIRICELIAEEQLKPELVIGVPVGFVNVIHSKELIMDTDIPHIVARGRKGGSNVAAAICNAILYQMDPPSKI